MVYMGKHRVKPTVMSLFYTYSELETRLRNPLYVGYIIISYLNLLFSRLGVAAIMTRQNTAVITANTRQTESRKLANHKETLSDRCWFCLYFGLLTFGKRLRMSGVYLSNIHLFVFHSTMIFIFSFPCVCLLLPLSLLFV